MAEEISPEIISTTQKSLGKYVKKPPLTEKLLKKPPFRFLHDVINSVIRETGFLKGLFSDSELLSDNVKDRENKLAFLNKLITAVKSISGVDLQVRASKIIAGLEPVETNKLLQSIATCIDKKLDSREYVLQLKKAKRAGTEKLKKVSSKSSKDSKEGKSKKDTSKTSSTLKVETPKTKTKVNASPRNAVTKDVDKKTKVKESPKGTLNSPKQSLPVPETPMVENASIESPRADSVEENDEKIVEIPKQEIIKEISETVERPVSVRPKSARPRSSDIRKEKVIVPEIPKPAPKVQESPKEEPPKVPEFRPRSSLLRPPSVRPSSARPGAPRLRSDSALPIREIVPLGKINVIVENFDGNNAKEEDEEETVVVETANDDLQDTQLLEKSLDMPADKGHLVEQILEQIKGPEQLEEHVKGTTIDWQQDSGRGRDATTKEINQLRGSIQSLTRTANPLGKLMSYLHEDVEAMHAELASWTAMKQQFTLEISKQKRLNSESNQPLLKQLKDLEDNIRKQREEISSVKYNILRNDERIRELVAKQVDVN
ncbi:PREDICTED: TRAF3-interacting protein 1 [Nicrophorus vespilloides]|uniref:TRAF3-interacting protein 1 n=1 Tax=Nicrophorus vespilloides TaxID=110193 RepID=A0ABM1N3J5_NICVS|nr:PREDICTED: TRAF3-interacting protein 1 [Nicrophorus vespilloides]XP_017781395.1 PREDICTED: TRAF3-interacting protein 1 [Nicrophorus vespilloides]